VSLYNTKKFNYKKSREKTREQLTQHNTNSGPLWQERQMTAARHTQMASKVMTMSLFLKFCADSLFFYFIVFL
jgi:hypothetical protein